MTDRPNQINIYGDHFQRQAVVTLIWEGENAGAGETPGHIQLDTLFISRQQLAAKVPANITKGRYGVKVVNPDGQRSPVVHAAYQAVSANPQETDDLHSRGENLWTTPNTLRVGESVSVGLTVFRLGGVGGVPPFAVSFYANEIDQAHFIGRGYVTGISPNSSASTSAVAWTPSTHGEVKLIAVIDPDRLIAETNEDNNTIRRKVSIHYVPQADTTPPIAQTLHVNGDQTQVSAPDVELSVAAYDPEPNPSGVAKSYYVELQWASGAGSGGSWIPVKWTSWSNFASQPHSYELMPNSGLRYLQAWVADGANNISARPATQLVNYVPGTDSLLQGEVRVFRPATLAGQCLLVRVQPAGAQMDPDIYVYAPGGSQAGYSILPAGEVDEVMIQPTEAGIYQVEIVAFTDATFTQSIQVLDNCLTGRNSNRPATVTADKQPRTQPSVPVENVPLGNETTPETIRQYISFISLTSRQETRSANQTIYLPALSR